LAKKHSVPDKSQVRNWVNSYKEFQSFSKCQLEGEILKEGGKDISVTIIKKSKNLKIEFIQIKLLKTKKGCNMVI